MASLSIVIVTYNPGDLILKCLQSIEAASTGLDVEVIVVDNASSDGTVDRVRAGFRQAKVIASSENLGFAAASNQGLAAAHGEYLLLLNPDVIAQPDVFTRMIRFMEDHPQGGIIGPRIYDGQNRIALTAYPAYTPWMILWQYLGFDRLFPYTIYGRYRRQCEQAVDAFEVESVQGSCLMLRREAYRQIGGLDESFFLYYEEADFCERARTRGWKVNYVPNACIVHYESSTTSRYTLIRQRSYHLSPLTYFRKRRRAAAVMILKLGFSVELWGKIAVRLVQSILKKRETGSLVNTYLTVLKELWAY